MEGIIMKNKKFITAVLVLSMMLMGAGYAAWTQDFTVTANVNTGHLDIGLAVVDGSDDDILGDVAISTVMPDLTVVANTYASGSVAVDTTVGAYAATATLERMYPGAVAEFDIVVSNTGTVGIRLDNIGTAVLNTDATLGTYNIEASIANGSNDIAVGGTETVHYVVTFIDGDDDVSENLSGKVNLSIPVTYKQFNQ